MYGFENIPDFSTDRYKDLISALNKGCCIFLGAGISKLAGYPLWEELKIKLIEIYKTNERIVKKHNFDQTFWNRNKDYSNISELFGALCKMDENLFISSVKKNFEKIYHENEKKMIDIYNNLNKFNNGKNIFITTNIDIEFQRYLSFDEKDISIYPDFPISSVSKLTYLHGRIDKEDSWVLTNEEYNEAYWKIKKTKNYLNKVFTTYPAIFIGYSLRDNEVSQIIKLVGRKYFWIEGYDRDTIDNLHMCEWGNKNNLQLIPYNVGQSGYENLNSVITKLFDVFILEGDSNE